MALLPPAKAVSRSKITDWFELTALISKKGVASSNDLANLLELEADGEDHGTEIDPVTGEALEREILDSATTALLESVHSEIEYRIKICGDYYPFELEHDIGAASLDGRFRLRNRLGDVSPDNKYIFYVLALLETGLRDQVIAVKDTNTTNHNLGLLFQIASCAAMGGYLRGDIVWFGFPRPDNTAFLPALTAAFKRFGCHAVLASIPAGYPANNKDAGIDILAWIDFGDGRGARTMLFGQVASGYDWSHKTLNGFIPKFLNWFTPPSPAHIKPAILIPFPIHHHVVESTEHSWEDQANGRMLYESSDFGVIFDRFRVAKFAAIALAMPAEAKAKIDGMDHLDKVSGWIKELMGELAVEGAA